MVSYDPLFFKRDGAGLLSFKDKMWILGGWRPGNLYNDVWSSDDGKNWTLVTDNAGWSPRHCAGYVVFKDKMWIISGDGYPDIWNSSDGRNWEQVLTDVPFGRRYAPLVFAFNDKLWLMGGASVIFYGFLMNYNDVWNSDDGVTWTKVLDQAPWPPRTTVDGPIIHDNKMWILGGAQFVEPSGQLPRNYLVDVWNSSDGINWNMVQDSAPWIGRIWASTKVYADKIWLMAGANDEIYETEPNRNDVWYTNDGKDWVSIKNSTWKPRHAASSTVFNNSLWLLAGTGGTSHGIKNDIWNITLDKLTFISQPDTIAFENSLYSYKAFADFGPKGQAIMYKLLDGPVWLSVDSAGMIQGVPDYRNVGDTVVSIEASTTGGQSVIQKFTIHVLRNIKVESPAVNNGVLINSVIDLKWKIRSAINYVDIKCSIDSGRTWIPIVSDLPADDGMFRWLTPMVTAENCILQVLNSENHLEQGFSKAFSLTPLAIENKPGNTIFSGSIHNIEWQLSSPQQVDNLFYSLVSGDAGVNLKSSLGSSANSLHYELKLPETSGDYRFSIYNSTDSSLMDEYDFKVVSVNDGLIAHLPFDSACINTIDYTDIGKIYGATLVRDSINHGNKYYYFDGLDDYIEISPLKCFPFEDEFSISMWINSGSLNAMSFFSLSGENANKNLDFRLNNFYQSLDVSWNSQGDNSLKSGNCCVYADNEWHHIVFKRNGSEVSLYVDSILITQDEYYGPIGSCDTISLGLGSFVPCFYHGYIDDIRIYNCSISPTIISALFKAGKRKLNLQNLDKKLYLNYKDILEIHWESQNISNINLEYSENNGRTWNLIQQELPTGSGYFSWNIPNIDSRQVRLKIRDSNDVNFFWLSDSITISSAPLFADTVVCEHYGDEPFRPEILYSGSHLVNFFSQDTTVIKVDDNKCQILGAGETYLYARFSDDTTHISSQKIVILKKDIYAVVNGISTYGYSDAKYDYKFEGFAGADSINTLEIIPDAVSSVTAETPAGEYPLFLRGGKDINYNFILDTGLLVVQKAPLQIIPDSVYRIYGDKNPQFTFKIAGFRNRDNADSLDFIPMFRADVDINSRAGDYPVYVSAGNDNNYNCTGLIGNLRIHKAPLLISADNKFRKYREHNPVFTFTIKGFKNFDTLDSLDCLPDIHTSADNLTLPGLYSIVISGGKDYNYEYKTENGILEIKKVVLNIVADNKQKFYGEKNPLLTYSIYGSAEENIDSLISKPTFVTAVSEHSLPGEYPINIISGADNIFEFVITPGTFKVIKSPLIIKVDDMTRYYGEKNPEPSLKITGLKNDDTIDSLLNKPVVFTNATERSRCGEYTLTPTCGPDNKYELIFIDGVLSIKPKPPQVETPLVRSLDSNSLLLEYSLISDGGSDVIKQGIIWSTDSSKMENVYFVDSEFNKFKEVFSHLAPNTRYYFRSFVTTSSGTDISEVTVVRTFGAGSGEISNSQIHIFPNPSNGIINIEMGDDFSSSIIEFYNSSGILIYEMKSDQQNLTIDLSFLPKGIYFTRIHNNKAYSYHKVILN